MTAAGIDLGTTISSIARADNEGSVMAARLRDGSPRLRSVVTIQPNGEVVLGDEAQALAPLDPDSSFAFFKREMGTGWSVPYPGGEWTATSLSAEILKALVADAAADFGGRPTKVAVTIPAYFGDDARRATLEAGKLAGLDVIALPHEPTAACLAYEPAADQTTTQLVYDLGGGTFDVSVVRFGPGGADVLATAGDHHLGGKGWDDVLVGLIAEQVEAATGDDPRDDIQLVTELLERARDAKHALSSVSRTAATVPVGGGLHRVEITRQQFEDVAAPLYTRTEAVVQTVLDDIGGRTVLDAVLLVGGSSRMPRCRDALVQATGLEPLRGIDPDAAVVTGAALVARNYEQPPRRVGAPSAMRAVRDATAHALGFVVVSADGSRYVNEVMIDRNSPIPAQQTKRHRLTVGSDGRGSLDVYMLQGEAERPLDTNPLGRWTFDNVPGGRNGLLDVDVAYEYDVDGVVHVSASVNGTTLAEPRLDRDDRDLAWTDDDPASHSTADVAAALTIDISSSMSGAKLEEAKEACMEFIDVLDAAGAGERIALVAFGSAAHVASPLSSTSDEVRWAAQALAVQGSTNMADGLAVARSSLSSVAGRRVIVLLTDGAPDDREAALTERNAIVQGDGEIIARGVQGADEEFLRELDSGSELLGSGELVSSFRGIAQQLAAHGGLRRGP